MHHHECMARTDNGTHSPNELCRQIASPRGRVQDQHCPHGQLADIRVMAREGSGPQVGQAIQMWQLVLEDDQSTSRFFLDTGRTCRQVHLIEEASTRETNHNALNRRESERNIQSEKTMLKLTDQLTDSNQPLTYLKHSKKQPKASFVRSWDCSVVMRLVRRAELVSGAKNASVPFKRWHPFEAKPMPRQTSPGSTGSSTNRSQISSASSRG